MNNFSANAAPQVPLMQGETIEVVFDAQGGLVAEPTPQADALVVTNERVVRDGAADGARVVSMFPLRELAAMEVSDNGRSFERLSQGIVLVAAGLIVGGLSWFILEIQVLSVILGGLPILAGIYMLTGWAFPDAEGALHLYAQGHAVALPLRSAAARESVYVAMQRIYELRWGEQQGAPQFEASAQMFAPPAEPEAAPVAESEAAPAAEPEAEEDASEEMEDALSRLVGEADANVGSPAPEPKQPRASIWDVFRRR